MTGLELIALNAVVIAAIVFALWLVSLFLRDVSFIDAFWPVGFAVVAWTTYVAAPPEHARGMLILAFTTLWAIRLGGYLSARWSAHGEEDKRYQAMRRKRKAFAFQSLYLVFGLQGALIVLVGTPVIFGIANADAPLGWTDGLGVLLFTAGFILEAVADSQLAAFKRDPENQGRVMDQGLWAWSRHPNYFGNTLIWWGLFALAIGDAQNWWTAIGPAVMTWLIIRVSGADLLERGLQRSKPGYAAYVARTSKFIPLPPRRLPRRTTPTGAE